jgi:hypothetical protein
MNAENAIKELELILRDMKSQDGKDNIKDKGLQAEGVFAWAMVEIIHAAVAAGISPVKLVTRSVRQFYFQSEDRSGLEPLFEFAKANRDV